MYQKVVYINHLPNYILSFDWSRTGSMPRSECLDVVKSLAWLCLFELDASAFLEILEISCTSVRCFNSALLSRRGEYKSLIERWLWGF